MNFLQVVISLIGVIGLIFLLFYLLMKVNKFSRVTGGSKLKIIDKANTGRDSSLLVVSVGGKLMLIGVSAGKIKKICDLDFSEEDYFKPVDDNIAPGMNFSDILSNILVFGPKKRELADKKIEGDETLVESDSQERGQELPPKQELPSRQELPPKKRERY